MIHPRRLEACALWWNPYALRIDCDVVKALRWVGSSNADWKRFPDEVRRRRGLPSARQAGLPHRDEEMASGR